LFYQVSLIKDRRRPSSHDAIAELHSKKTLLRQQKITIYGIFTGLFGLATNEIYVVTSAAYEHDLGGVFTDTALNIETSHLFLPTVRPTTHAPLKSPGIYVFRWFTVKNEHTTEIVNLSKSAWKSFESGFDTEIQALFAEPESDAVLGQMLLITRYADLSVWEASRQPADDARENFQRRHALTIEARAIATQLVE